jgi:hypothetical protein
MAQKSELTAGAKIATAQARELARLRNRQTRSGAHFYRRLYRRSGRHLRLPVAHCDLAG